MHARHLEFKIDQLRKDKMIMALNSISVFIFSLFVTLFLPQLLFQFVFANQNLTAEPPVLTYIPAVGFAIGVVYFAYAAFMVVTKTLKLKQLNKELEMMMMDDSDDCGCGCGDCSVGDHAHHGMDSMSDEMDESMPSSRRRTVGKKKTVRRV